MLLFEKEILIRELNQSSAGKYIHGNYFPRAFCYKNFSHGHVTSPVFKAGKWPVNNVAMINMQTCFYSRDNPKHTQTKNLEYSY